MSTIYSEPGIGFDADTARTIQCATLDGLRALVQFLERHPEALGPYSSDIVVQHHAMTPAEFLALEGTIGGTRRTGVDSTYVVSERDFGGRVRLAVQTHRGELEATPQRVAAFLDLPDDGLDNPYGLDDAECHDDERGDLMYQDGDQ